ncbi:unnamed protein product [Rangifer tarandus platyrhynchus]|uniref:Uncharacterized protein n=1 Tax=Rangifer tarandus platyrhynchus TaxID=3082113 RepID=A0ABN8ZK22_RANTA|nr:unnamed protein product [Rangifer tarandus platyrhynchus]
MLEPPPRGQWFMGHSSAALVHRVPNPSLPHQRICFPLNCTRRRRLHAVLQSCSLLQPGSILRHKSRDITCPLRFASSTVFQDGRDEDSAVSLPRAQVQSLGRELRPHKPCGMAKKGKRKKKGWDE